jgi:hypothetical protein
MSAFIAFTPDSRSSPKAFAANRVQKRCVPLFVTRHLPFRPGGSKFPRCPYVRTMHVKASDYHQDMAVKEIVSAIDAYIAKLKEARGLIASLCAHSDTKGKEPIKRNGRGKRKARELLVRPPIAPEVVVQVIPARAPRQRQRQAKPASQTVSALGGPIPEGPVVVRSSDLAHLRSPSDQGYPSVQKSDTSSDTLGELAQDVERLLSRRGGAVSGGPAFSLEKSPCPWSSMPSPR